MASAHFEDDRRDEATARVRAARRETNALIVARDPAGLGRYFQEDVRLIGGDAELFVGRDACLDAYRLSFDDRHFIAYVRHADAVEIGVTGDVAAERGHWEGMWEGPDARLLRGSYQAMWRMIDGHWLIQAELYVCLDFGTG